MIQTARLKLIPFTEAQIDAILAKDLVKLGELLGVNTPHEWTTFDGAAEVIPFFYEMIRSQAGDTRFGSYFTTHIKDKALIGTCGYKGKADAPNSVEIGYEIHPHYQLQGLATEVAQALVNFAHSHGIKSIKAHTLAEENASGKILIKCGFKKIGEITDPTDGKLWSWSRDR